MCQVHQSTISYKCALNYFFLSEKWSSFNGWLSSTNYVWRPCLCLATKWTGLEIHQNPWAAQTTQPVSASVCPRLHNKGQHVGEATKIFLEYKIFSIPGQKSVCYKCLEIQFKWKIIAWMLIWLYGVRQPWHMSDGPHLVLYLISENIMGIKLLRKVGN